MFIHLNKDATLQQKILVGIRIFELSKRIYFHEIEVVLEKFFNKQKPTDSKKTGGADSAAGKYLLAPGCRQISPGSGCRQISPGSGCRQISPGSGSRQISPGSGCRQISPGSGWLLATRVQQHQSVECFFCWPPGFWKTYFFSSLITKCISMTFINLREFSLYLHFPPVVSSRDFLGFKFFPFVFLIWEKERRRRQEEHTTVNLAEENMGKTNLKQGLHAWLIRSHLIWISVHNILW